jgi:hypothetical protein
MPSNARADAYGFLAEFDNPGTLVAAAQRAYERGYRRMDAYSPYPVEGLAQALGDRRNFLPLVTLLGGILGGGGAYLLQYWTSVVDYPIDVGGRPLHSWPSFIPVAFETTILFAGLAAVIGMVLASGLPRLYHPVFNVPAFQRASRDGFFLCIEARDPQFDFDETRQFLDGLNARNVIEIER